MGMLTELRVVRGAGTAYSWGTLVGHQRGNTGISGQYRDINRAVAEQGWNNSWAPVGQNWGTKGKMVDHQREYGGIAVGKQWGTIGKNGEEITEYQWDNRGGTMGKWWDGSGKMVSTSEKMVRKEWENGAAPVGQ